MQIAEAVVTDVPDLTAEQLMTRDVVTVPPSTTLGEALELMRRLGIRHLPVTTGGCFVGMLDDRLVSLALVGESDAAALDRPVDEVMTRYVPQVRPTADLVRVARLLQTSRCDAVVVVDAQDHLLGLVTMVDLVGAVARPADV